MLYINLNIGLHLRSPEFVGSSPAERGTWLSVLAYACSIECSGRLVGAASWKNRQWQQAAGVTMGEVRASRRLLVVEGDDVVVFGYSVDRETQVQQNRIAGQIGGGSTSEAKRAAARENGRKGGRRPNGGVETTTNGTHQVEHQEPNVTQTTPSEIPTERKVKERKEEEGKSEPNQTPLSAAQITSTPSAQWTYQRLEPWARSLLAIPGIRYLDADRWPQWKFLVDSYGLDRVLAAAKALPAEARWPDRCENALQQANAASPEQSDPEIDSMDQMIRSLGWRAVLAAAGIGNVDSEDRLRQALTANRPVLRSVLARKLGAA